MKLKAKSLDAYLAKSANESIHGSPFSRQKEKELEFLAGLQASRTTIEGAAVQKDKEFKARDSLILSAPDSSLDKEISKRNKALTDSILKDTATLQAQIEGDPTAIQVLDQNLAPSAVIAIEPLKTTLGDLDKQLEAMRQLKIPASLISTIKQAASKFPKPLTDPELSTIRLVKNTILELETKILKSRKATQSDKELAKNQLPILSQFLSNLEADSSNYKLLDLSKDVGDKLTMMQFDIGTRLSDLNKNVGNLGESMKMIGNKKEGESDKKEDGMQLPPPPPPKSILPPPPPPKSKESDARISTIMENHKGQKVKSPVSTGKVTVGSAVWLALTRKYDFNDDGSFAVEFTPGKFVQKSGPPSKDEILKRSQELRKSSSDSSSDSQLSEAEKIEAAAKTARIVQINKRLAEIKNEDKALVKKYNSSDDDNEANEAAIARTVLKSERIALEKEKTDLNADLTKLNGNGLDGRGINKGKARVQRYNQSEMLVKPTKSNPVNQNGYIKLGKLNVNLKRFRSEKVFQAKIRGKHVMPPGRMSDDLERLLVSGPKKSDLSLPSETVDLYRLILEKAGFDNPNLFTMGARRELLFGAPSGKVKYVYYNSPLELYQRLSILMGEVNAGNDSKQIKEEAGQLISRLKNDGVIGDKEYLKLQENFGV